MPELPEVETIRSQLDPLLRGAGIVAARAFPSEKFTPAIEAVGATITGVGRRGKYLLVGLDRPRGPGELVVHLGMTGRLSVSADPRRPPPPGPSGSTWAAGAVGAAAEGATTRDAPAATVIGARPLETGAASPDEPAPHRRATWTLDDGRELRFDDVRRFGRILVVDRGEHSASATLAALGPEPSDEAFTPEALRARVNASRRAVKTHLLSQRIVAGVGNIYADEALWRARVHPSSRRLTRAESGRLRDAVREVIAAGIANGGTTLRDYRDAAGGEGSNQHFLDCYGRAGEPCRRCGTVLRRSVVDARSSVWCPTCQRRRS